VEILFPIVDTSIKIRITKVLNTLLSDNVKAREQAETGYYDYVQSKEDAKDNDAQMTIYKMAYRVSDDEE
jgi:polyphosphate kinase